MQVRWQPGWGPLSQTENFPPFLTSNLQACSGPCFRFKTKFTYRPHQNDENVFMSLKRRIFLKRSERERTDTFRWTLWRKLQLWIVSRIFCPMSLFYQYRLYTRFRKLNVNCLKNVFCRNFILCTVPADGSTEPYWEATPKKAWDLKG